MKHKHVFSLCLCICLSLLFLRCSKDDDQIDPQESPFIGTWKLVKFEGNTFSGNIVWTFTESTVNVSVNDTDSFSGSYTYDSNSNPKTVDIAFEGVLPNPNFSIYTFMDQETLILKIMDGAETRATNFEVEEGYDLEEFSRQ